MKKVETVILETLIYDEEYARKVLPFIFEDYFHDKLEKVIFSEIATFFLNYNTSPTNEALVIEIDKRSDLSDDEFESITQQVTSLVEPDTKPDDTWLLDTTEKFCKDKAIYNGIMKSIKILDDEDGKTSKNAIPEILSEALAVSFDDHVGHDFIDDAEDRFAFYHKKESRVKFDLDYFNKVTGGGLPKKTLNILLAGTGVGKTLCMCHMASANLMDGKNVLYITMEMAEERIAERIDANLLNVTLDELMELSKTSYDKKLGLVKGKTAGKLIIKEYPTASAGAGHFRHLLNELRLKRSFVPDIIYIDYINICISTRIKPGANVNSYTYVKSIAEELRGLAQERLLPIVSATQTTRSGSVNSDPDLTDTSESFGLPATCDGMWAVITNEELEALNQFLIKQLKNRYKDVTKYKRFVIGVDKAKMRLYDVEQSAQTVGDDEPVMDKTTFGEEISFREKKDFSGFNV